MRPDHHPVEHPEPAFTEAMRQHLDTINRNLVTAGDPDVADAALALAISDHLDDVGLDDINAALNRANTAFGPLFVRAPASAAAPPAPYPPPKHNQKR